MDLGQSYALVTHALDGFLNLDPLVNSIQRVLDDYRPAADAIAFILLVVGTLREFLYPETRRFFENLLRAAFLVGAISFAPDYIDWCDQAAKALAELPAAEQVNFGDSSYSMKPGRVPTVIQLESVLQEKIQGSDFPGGGSGDSNGNAQFFPQFSANPLNFGKNVEIAWKYVAAIGQNLVWQILFGIYLLCLLLCKVIIILMQFLQKVVVIGFKLYTPIGIAEYAHRSLKSKAIGFFLTFVGVLAWPVGWSLVNTVSLGIFKSLPTPESQNIPTLIIAIVLAIPVLLWVLVGHVIAPVFVQKVVIRGGAVVQGFAGTIFSAVGASSMAIYGAGPAGLANWLRNVRQNEGDGGAGARSRDTLKNPGSGEFILAPDRVLSTGQGGMEARTLTPPVREEANQRQTKRAFAGVGAGMMDAGAGILNRFGSVTRFIGHAVVEGSGEGSGLEYRAISAFAPLGSNTRASVNRTNRSSLQARKYLNYR